MDAQEAKEAGAAAWSAGKYDEAVTHFTRAIEASTDKDFLKTIYSNRSAAYMKLNQPMAAMLDGNKCVELDSNWARGFTRKGDACYALKRSTEAYNAYNTALRLSPGDSAIKTKLDLAERMIRNESTSSSSSGSAAPINKLTSLQNYARVALLVSAILYFLPFGRFSQTCYRVFVFTAIANYIYVLYSTHGMPQFNMSYAQRVLPDPTTSYLFLCILLLSARPYVLAMAPVFLTEATHAAHYIYTVGAARSPDMMDRVTNLIDSYAPAAMKKSADEWRRMSNSARWSLVQTQVVETAALCEVLQGLFLILELILPTRNFLGTLMWWQFLQMRYMLDQSGNVKRTFAMLDRKIMGLLSHSMCPPAVRTGYDTLKGYLAKRVQPPAPGQQQPGFSMPKCTIM